MHALKVSGDSASALRVTVVGAGYVGLVSAACFAEIGAVVTCVDVDPDKISLLRKGEIPIYEPGLLEIVRENVRAGRLSFGEDVSAAAADSSLAFIAVGTPSLADGSADLSYVRSAVAAAAASLPSNGVVVVKSTVPVGAGAQMRQLVEELGVGVEVASNPEFLREGSAVSDFMEPDRIVVGCRSQNAFRLLERLYAPLVDKGARLLKVDVETAELIKYASNAFLAAKITFINEIADYCERIGADVAGVALGMGLDARIGSKFLQPGPGYGGSCFPKDTRALAHAARAAGTPIRLVETTIAVNAERKRSLANRVAAECDGGVAGKTIAVLGVTFKAGTDDMRDAPALDLLPMLVESGAKVKVYDPVGAVNAATLLDGVEWCESVHAAAQDADLAVVMTEWREFLELDLSSLKGVMKRPALLDFRNLFDGDAASKAGFAYSSIGRSSRRTEGRSSDPFSPFESRLEADEAETIQDACLDGRGRLKASVAA